MGVRELRNKESLHLDAPDAGFLTAIQAMDIVPIADILILLRFCRKEAFFLSGWTEKGSCWPLSRKSHQLPCLGMRDIPGSEEMSGIYLHERVISL